MTTSSAAWLVIVSAIVMANLPFVLDRPIAAWGWAPSQGLTPGLRWLRCAGFLAGFGLWSWGTLRLLGGAFAGGGSAAGTFFIKFLVSVLVIAAWLYWPGRRPAGEPDGAPASGGPAPDARAGGARAVAAAHAGRLAEKPVADRFLEVLLGYVLVGTLGNALELNLGNAFTQGWEFYAVTLALFLVLGYPGFVWRYMLRRRHRG